MRTVTLFMHDEINNKPVNRTIDGSNLMVADNFAPDGWECNVLGTENQIKDNLETWISERGNQQHNTILTLLSWSINKA